jgi:hypothetical protein
MQESIRTNNSRIKHKTENHGENIYCRPIYGLNTKKKKKNFFVIEQMIANGVNHRHYKNTKIPEIMHVS